MVRYGESFTSEERKRLRYGRKGIAAEITDFFIKNFIQIISQKTPRFNERS
jgi:hypothetical protein